MRPPRHYIALSLSLLLLTRFAQAVEYAIDCPRSIPSNNVQIVGSPPNWTGAVQGPFWLRSAGPMDGPPSDMAILKEGATTKRSGMKTMTTWDISGTFSAGKWMACNYGLANDLVLSTRLDDKTSACTVTSVQQASGKVDISILCKQ